MQQTTKSHEVIRALKAISARHGIQEELRSDNSPLYASAEFTHFAKEWDFRHTTSSPRFPQSNGEAERAVETTKSLLKKEKDPTKGLLAYRSTPLACGYSPSELLMGRNSEIPSQPSTLFLIQVGQIWKATRKRSRKQGKAKAEFQSSTQCCSLESTPTCYSCAH